MNLDIRSAPTQEQRMLDDCAYVPPDRGFKEETCRKCEPGTLAAVDWWQTLQVSDTRVVEIGARVHGSEFMIACVGHGLCFVCL